MVAFTFGTTASLMISGGVLAALGAQNSTPFAVAGAASAVSGPLLSGRFRCRWQGVPLHEIRGRKERMVRKGIRPARRYPA
jgi:hypothetical protein